MAVSGQLQALAALSPGKTPSPAFHIGGGKTKQCGLNGSRQSALNFLANVILTCYCGFVFDLCFISYCYVMTRSFILVRTQYMHLVTLRLPLDPPPYQRLKISIFVCAMLYLKILLLYCFPGSFGLQIGQLKTEDGIRTHEPSVRSIACLKPRGTWEQRVNIYRGEKCFETHR
jgi:hypothetical protein